MNGRAWARATAVMGIVCVLMLVATVLSALVTPAEGAIPRTLRVCSANIQNTPDMPDWKVRADVAKIKKRCDLVLWQEISERADHRAVTSVLGANWRTTPRTNGKIPISWRTGRLTKIGDLATIRVSRGTPRCANGRPSYNPARYISRVPFRIRGTGKRLTVVNLHFPQRGRHTCRPAVTDQRWREAYFNTSRALPATTPVLIGGDWNRREGEIRPMTKWHWITERPRSLDHMAVARSGMTVRDKFTVPLHSDHALTGSVLHLGVQ
jgi:hypothetical protein